MKNIFVSIVGGYQYLLCVFLVGALSGCSMLSRPPDPAPSTVPHVVRFSGETLGVLSVWYTGTSRHWEKIRDANPNLDVRRIKIGQVIQIPIQFVKSPKVLTAKAVGEIRAMIEGEPRDSALAWREADDANYNYPVRTIQGCEELPNSLTGLHECANRVGRTLEVKTIAHGG